MKKGPKTAARRTATTRIAGVTRRIVSPAAWRRARERMRVREKAHMHAGDELAAARRRMPWMRMDKDYRFEGPQGRVRLVDLFEGRTQLILYHFMFGPRLEGGPEKGFVC